MGDTGAADAAKDVANAAYKRGEYAVAVKKYGIALRLAAELPEQPRPGKLESTRQAQLLANRCMAYLALGEDRSALTDAEQAIRAAPGWPKAYFRHGTVLMRVKNYTKAYAAFKQGHHLDTSNQELQLACQQAHQKMVGLDTDDAILSQEQLVVLREKKFQEEKRERAAAAEARRAASSTANPYRDEALRRTVQMATGSTPGDPTHASQPPPVADDAADLMADAVYAAEKSEANAPEVEKAALPAVLPAAPALSSAPASEMPSASSTPSPAVPEHALHREAVASAGRAGSGDILVLTVELPLVTSMRELSLSVSPDKIELEMVGASASTYAPLTVALPANIDDDAASANFDKRQRKLVIRLPVAECDTAPYEGELV